MNVNDIDIHISKDEQSYKVTGTIPKDTPTQVTKRFYDFAELESTITAVKQELGCDFKS